ncbi:uncharacterized protein LOC100908350 [Galendromus occidentalis]|uniref:Uncharacterized protein LOC100908350 n=1 Tax=Galendromus occidentalis TaxID=34638 RepID=A0AAJ6VW76_9ACAR|nr:uncharacterized protein LOC100908350 [Galendromus occidentalis]
MKFANVTLKCAYTNFIPMVIMYHENNDPNGRKRMWGLVGSAFANITSSLGIDYELIEPPDGIHGGPLENGSYDGTMGLVKRNEVDIASGPFPLTGDLFDNFLTFYPFKFIDLAIIGGFQKEYESHPFVSILEFNVEVRWTYLAIILFSTLLSGFLMHRYREMGAPERDTSSPLTDSFLGLYAFTLGTGSLAHFNHLAIRLLYLGWSVGMFFLVCYFTSWVCASSAVKTPTPRINNVATLTKYPHIVPYILKGCSLLKEFKECPLPHYRELYRMVKDNDGERIPSEQFEIENLQKVTNNEGVIISDVPCVESHMWRCSLLKGMMYVAEERIAQMQFTWAAVWELDPKIVAAINERVHWITEMAVPWMRSFDINPKLEDCLIRGKSKQRTTFIDLGLFDVAAAFYLHLFLCGFSISLLIGEVIMRSCRDKSGRLKDYSFGSFTRLSTPSS